METTPENQKEFWNSRALSCPPPFHRLRLKRPGVSCACRPPRALNWDGRLCWTLAAEQGATDSRLPRRQKA